MKKLLTLIIGLTLTINVFAIDIWDGTSSPWTNGSGTADDPYLIETAANLAYLAEKVNEGYQASGQAVYHGIYFLMTDDFDLNNINWTPIGNVTMSMEGFYFAGIFDGWYHNIDHLKIQTNADVCGLFAGLGSTAEIKHLSVTNGVITSTGTGVGGIVGATAGNSLVEQCSFSGTLSVSNSGSFCGAGGITAAAAESSRIVECSFSGSITANNNGGFTGAAGAGGIVGIAMDNAGIFSCYNTGSITSSSFMLNVAAGIVSATLQENSVTVNSCYNTGTLSGSTKGGIFGMISPINPYKGEADINVTNCYYLNTCGGTTNYGTSMTASQMQTEQFKNQIDMSAHRFVMDNGSNNGYPIHALTGFRLFEANDITAHSAMFSADLHPGNDSFSRAYFFCVKMDDTDYQEVEIDTEGYVEAIVEGLDANTEYMFSMSVEYSDGSFVGFGPYYFTTADNATIDEFNNPIIQIYPNPTSDFIHIDCKDVSENVSTPVTIYSIDGKLIKTIENTSIIDVRDLNEGIYLINIGGTIKKFAVETP